MIRKGTAVNATVLARDETRRALVMAPITFWNLCADREGARRRRIEMVPGCIQPCPYGG